MEIYGEYLFAENFIAGLVILYFTGRLGGIEIRKWLLITGAFACGVYSFIIFVDMNPWVSMLSEIVFSAAAVLIAYPAYTTRGITHLLKCAFTFYIISFLLGGITIALMYFTGIRGVSGNGAFYIENFTYINVYAGLFVGYLLTEAFVLFLRKRRLTQRTVTDVSVKVNGRVWRFRALIDTGNFLKEPISGKPVVIIENAAAAEILGSFCDSTRFTVIPFSTLGVRRGLMEAFRVDEIIVGNKVIMRALIAVYKGEFEEQGAGEGYQMLLNQDMLEGGVS